VLWYGGRVCDARFSKCCGGALEEFKYCWENKEVPYLKYARDYASGRDWDLTRESNARRWILSSPRAFCNTRSARLLGQVLKDYDSETKDFYRWTVEYSAEELRQIILERTGEDYGEIRDLIPLERGVSGRICRLKIVGSQKTKTIGKELEIRKTLSRSHLYSSAFVVEKVYCPASGAEKVCEAEHRLNKKSDAEQSFLGAEGRIPAKFILHGAGWGHGVGLCQIGAAAMGARGYKYQDILQHYYPNSTLKNIY
ncbi:MAG: amidase, partial [Bacteroidales bacterium]|nr:amidase [Bacteroidales bacterium]